MTVPKHDFCRRNSFLFCSIVQILIFILNKRGLQTSRDILRRSSGLLHLFCYQENWTLLNIYSCITIFVTTGKGHVCVMKRDIATSCQEFVHIRAHNLHLTRILKTKILIKKENILFQQLSALNSNHKHIQLPICRDYKSGNCRRDSCRYVHVDNRELTVSLRVKDAARVLKLSETKRRL